MEKDEGAAFEFLNSMFLTRTWKLWKSFVSFYQISSTRVIPIGSGLLRVSLSTDKVPKDPEFVLFINR